ncbi:hypothetical protein KP509_24G079400 [Ceratopteris richardii]|uniref:ENTH domain-containing protein n=1 Tax=Ceratopteris richardii TaxID=49495 RepID=A0A8T2RZB1_CERRI|nr:hypothetical protein KP509_24G079400 [Ceratopteris richardii]
MKCPIFVDCIPPGIAGVPVICMDSMQGKFRKAFGAVKDQTSISIAKVASAGSSDIEVAVLKATSHDEAPFEEKYVQELLYLTSRSPLHVHVCIAAIARRLRKTHNWIVAIKTLMLAHRLLRDGDAAIEHGLATAQNKGMRVLTVYAFRDESHSNGGNFSAFVRAYGLYLEERLECSVPSIPPPKHHESSKDNPTFGGHKIHHRGSSSPSPSGSDEDRNRNKQRSSQRRKRPVKKMRPPELIHKFPAFQRLLDRILGCRPSGAAKANRLVLFALHPVVRESFLVFSDIRDGMAILLDAFFELEQQDCLGAFDIYKKAAKQLDELHNFYDFCRSLGVCKASEYPTIEKVSNEMLETMSASLRLRLDAGRGSSKKSKPQQIRSVSFREDVRGDCGDGSKGTKSDPPYSSRPATNPRITLNPQPSPNLIKLRPAVINHGKNSPNLLDLDENPSISIDNQENQLALALFSGPETSINTTWVKFSPDAADTKRTMPFNLLETKTQETGWELALVDSESKFSRPFSQTLAGGFDHLLLNNLYDQGAENRIRQAAAIGPGGSASSMVNGLQVQASLLALPATSATGCTEEASQVQRADPFAASANVPPPPYVQMSDLRSKQQLLVREQQQWFQYQQQKNDLGYHATLMNFASNPFLAGFQSPTYPVPYSGIHSYYA